MTAGSFVDTARAPEKAEVGLEFLGYFACSAAALATDFGLLGLGLAWGLDYRVAAAFGFLAGLALAYGLSVRFVFRTRAVVDRRVEFLIFAAIGLLGLLITEALMWALVSRFGLGPALAKVPVAGFVFLFNFGARKALLFTRRPGALGT